MQTLHTGRNLSTIQPSVVAMNTATYVLVPGFWLGAWVWRPVADSLSERGHVVHAVDLSGMGERAHLASPETDLTTHIDDVVHLLEQQNLHDVVLVGHSYGALVTTTLPSPRWSKARSRSPGLPPPSRSRSPAPGSGCHGRACCAASALSNCSRWHHTHRCSRTWSTATGLTSSFRRGTGRW